MTQRVLQKKSHTLLHSVINSGTHASERFHTAIKLDEIRSGGGVIAERVRSRRRKFDDYTNLFYRRCSAGFGDGKLTKSR